VSSEVRIPRALVALGGCALLVAMSVDAIAVVGRHIGVPLLGSIEIVQAAVLVSGAVALFVATLAGVHARVHLLVDHAPPLLRRLLARGGLLLAALMFLAMFASSVWICANLWQGQEESELLHVPYRPLRIFTAVAALSVAATFLWQALRREQR
jgi:TRAP-type C4-dicarboxylate transport system permease small subunit